MLFNQTDTNSLKVSDFIKKSVSFSKEMLEIPEKLTNMSVSSGLKTLEIDGEYHNKRL